MRNLLVLIFLAITFCSCKKNTNWTSLLDKELSDWDNYLSFKYQIGEDGEGEGPPHLTKCQTSQKILSGTLHYMFVFSL